ncbi:mediator of RNA polymerase II transcription subunit 18 [Phanerochaete sordida]|uniref:Mediator of RNA polymerase II transcription subunit 18 n=1 Tax=Phanerochaete sordida TaxID=48140 RepID=A0A9P3L7M1_9APHY|nr:mediator of RNA polymerase II transcription subunit 18 [Phanerochaete sordida]
MAAAQAHSYEVALFGEFFAKDLSAILNRITLHSESAHRMHAREVVFEPFDASHQRETGSEPVLLRARKEMLEPNPKWMLYSYLKPESVRINPEATVRPCALCQVVGDALSFASALGYVRRSQIYKRGYVFRRGMLVIQMFQQEQADPTTQKPIPAHADTLWEVEVKTATPFRTQDTPMKTAIDAVLEVQLLMKGLLDLRRQDV